MIKFRKQLFFYFMFILLAIESVAQVGIRVSSGRWLWQTETYCYQRLFQVHPWLAVAAKPSTTCAKGQVTITFNSLGLRGPELSRVKEKKRVVCYGGSSTFCTQVSDNQTWPYYLQQILAEDDFEVINTGVPGYTSVEAVIQTALEQLDLQPDICIYYLGWNDLRNMHIKGLKSDYSDFHGPSQINNFRLGGWVAFNKSATFQLAGYLIRRLTQFEKIPKGGISSDPDPRALEIYKNNLETLIAICRARNIRIIFIPQVLNYSNPKLLGDKPYDWAPFVKEKDVRKFITCYNKVMFDIARKGNVLYVESVLNFPWRPSDFVDEGHFSSAGNKKFAQLIAEAILDLK